MPSEDELIDFVQDILEEVAIGDPHYSHDYRLPFFRDASQLAAARLFSRWPHIAGPERVEGEAQ